RSSTRSTRRRPRSFGKRCSRCLSSPPRCRLLSRSSPCRLAIPPATLENHEPPRSRRLHGMSNIAGKAYAMNAITPMRWYTAWLNRFFFWGSGRFTSFLGGLLTLSLIHYARWVILKPNQFPRLSPDQPEEQLKYHYMFFFSNFNGSWDQYVDSFSSAISGGLD